MSESRYSATLRLLTAFALLIAAVLKGHLLFLEYFEDQTISAGIVSLKLTLIAAEIILAIWLLSAPITKWSACVVCSFFAIFAFASLVQYMRGVDSCGCFGVYKVSPIYSGIFSLSIALGFGLERACLRFAWALSFVRLASTGIICASTALLVFHSVDRNHILGRETPYYPGGIADEDDSGRAACSEVIRALYGIDSQTQDERTSDNPKDAVFPFSQLAASGGLRFEKLDSARTGSLLEPGPPARRDTMFIVRSAKGLHAVLSAWSNGDEERWQVSTATLHSHFVTPAYLLSADTHIWKLQPVSQMTFSVGTDGIAISPRFVNLGALSLGQAETGRVTISQISGSSAIEMVDAKPSCGCLTVTSDRTTITRDQPISITVSTRGAGASVHQEVTLRLREVGSKEIVFLKVPVIGTVLRKVEVYPGQVDFGVVVRGKPTRRRVRVSTPEQVVVDRVVVDPQSLPLKTTTSQPTYEDGVRSQYIDLETEDGWPCQESVRASLDIILGGTLSARVPLISIAQD